MKKSFKILFVILLVTTTFYVCSKKEDVKEVVNENIKVEATDSVSKDVNASEKKEEAKTVEVKAVEPTKEEPKKEETNTIESKAVESKKVEAVVVPTTSVKTSGKVIVIDPGHGNHSNLEQEKTSPDSNVLKIKDGGGAQGVSTKIPEYKLNMDVALKLKSILENKGYKVIMTKTLDAESPGNIDRAEVGNKNNADLVVRIHADSSENSSVTGVSMLVPSETGYSKPITAVSKKYGNIVLNKIVSDLGVKNRGVVAHSDMTGFNWSKVPVILVEMGFMSNSVEDKLINSENYKGKMANALASGIELSLNN